MRSSRSVKKLRLPVSKIPGVVQKAENVDRGRAIYFLRDLLFEVLLFLVPPRLVLTDRPLRPSLRNFPASISCSSAPRTTLRATFSELASSRSLGSKVPTANSPASIRSLSCSRICRVIDSGRFLLTRTLSLVAIVNSLQDEFEMWGFNMDSMQRLTECQTVFFSV